MIVTDSADTRGPSRKKASARINARTSLDEQANEREKRRCEAVAKVLIEDASGDLDAKQDIPLGTQEAAELNARVSEELRRASMDMQIDESGPACACRLVCPIDLAVVRDRMSSGSRDFDIPRAPPMFRRDSAPYFPRLPSLGGSVRYRDRGCAHHSGAAQRLIRCELRAVATQLPPSQRCDAASDVARSVRCAVDDLGRVRSGRSFRGLASPARCVASVPDPI